MSIELTNEKKFGNGWKLLNGDLIVDASGIVQQVIGTDNGVQGLQTLLLTQLGEDQIHPAVGMDFLGLMENSSHLNRARQIEFAGLMIRTALLQDDRVQGISSVDYVEDDSVGRTLAFKVILTMFNQEDLTVQLGVEL